MSGTGPTAAILRFWAGALGGILAGYAVFGDDVFRPGAPPFQCVTIGVLMALLLAAVRGGRPRRALLFVLGFALVQFGSAWSAGWPLVAARTLAGLSIAGGLFLIAVIFDRLALSGFWFGKFLVAGPLLGGIYFAVSPLALWDGLPTSAAFQNLLKNLVLGILIGDGVGLGVETIELLPGLHTPPRGAQQLPDAPAPGDGP